MYTKLFTLAALATAALAAPQGITNSCNVGVQHCCNQVQTVGSQTVQNLISKGLIGADVALGDVGALVGLSCTPVSVLALSGNNW